MAPTLRVCTPVQTVHILVASVSKLINQINKVCISDKYKLLRIYVAETKITSRKSRCFATITHF